MTFHFKYPETTQAFRLMGTLDRMFDVRAAGHDFRKHLPTLMLDEPPPSVQEIEALRRAKASLQDNLRRANGAFRAQAGSLRDAENKVEILERHNELLIKRKASLQSQIAQLERDKECLKTHIDAGRTRAAYAERETVLALAAADRERRNWEAKYARVRAALDPQNNLPEDRFSLVELARIVRAGLVGSRVDNGHEFMKDAMASEIKRIKEARELRCLDECTPQEWGEASQDAGPPRPLETK